MKKTTRKTGGFLYITNSRNLGSGVAAVRRDLYKGKETFPHCQSLALRERWHFACEMTERVRHERCRGFLVGAGVSASRAAKKAPLGLFCPAGRKRRAAAVRIHPRGCVFGFLQKKKTSVFSTLIFLVGGTQAPGRSCSNPPAGVCLWVFAKEKDQRIFYADLFGGAKQPKSEPLPSGASLAAISSNVMVFVPSL